MLKGNKYRIYPTPEQTILLNKHMGCTRLVYNLGLGAKTMAYNGSKVNVTRYDLQEQLVDMKNDFLCADLEQAI